MHVFIIVAVTVVLQNSSDKYRGWIQFGLASLFFKWNLAEFEPSILVTLILLRTLKAGLQPWKSGFEM